MGIVHAGRYVNQGFIFVYVVIVMFFTLQVFKVLNGFPMLILFYLGWKRQKKNNVSMFDWKSFITMKCVMKSLHSVISFMYMTAVMIAIPSHHRHHFRLHLISFHKRKVVSARVEQNVTLAWPNRTVLLLFHD